MEHFKEYLTYSPFVVRTDNNLLTYVLTTPNLDATGHWWVGTLASFQFELEYQKGADNGTADALSWVPISHSWETIQSLLEGTILGAADRGKVRASEELLEEHKRLSQKARVQAGKLAAMHIVDWAEAQEVDAALATCCKWLYIRKDMPLPKWDTLLKKCLGVEAEMELGKTMYALVVVMKDQTAKTVAKVFYKHFIAVFGVPARLLSDRGTNFMSTLVEELCAAFGIQKCCTTT